MFLTRSMIAALALRGVLAQAAAPARAAEFLLRLGSTNPPGSAADAEFEAIARAIERESDGRIEVASNRPAATARCRRCLPWSNAATSRWR